MTDQLVAESIKPEPSVSSVQITPGSIKTSFTIIFIVLAHDNVRIGAVVSIISATVPVVSFHAGSLTIMVGSLMRSDHVPVQITSDHVDGVGTQVVPLNATTSHDAMLLQVITT